MKRIVVSIMSIILGFVLLAFSFGSVRAEQQWVMWHHENQCQGLPNCQDETWDRCMPVDSINGHDGHKDDHLISGPYNNNKCEPEPPTATPEPPTETPVPPTETPVPTNTPENPTPTAVGPTPTPGTNPTNTPVINPTKTPPVIPPHPTKTPAPKPTGGESGSLLPILGFGLIGLGLLVFPWKKVLS